MVPCPFLPLPERVLTHEDMHALGADRTRVFYFTALNYAHSLWLAGFPAKALLLINRALSCNLPDIRLNGAAKPYHAVAWILQNRPPGRFIGNPRRHYQHLATRMVEPHKALRTWRAWACWHLSRKILSEADFPPDLDQVREEWVIKPRRDEIAENLGRLSRSDDRAAWEDALSRAAPDSGPPAGEITLAPAGVSDIGEIARLARAIWPQVYPSIISPAQIDYMLERSYSTAALERDLAEHGMHYAIIREGSESVGYVAWEAVAEGPWSFLHKLYLLPQRQGHGIGARVLRWVEEEARERGLRSIRLRVNRRNSPAIRAYLRAGFVFESEVCSDIGNGFVMDDFIMTKTVTAS